MYDVKIHTPVLIEALLNCEHTGDYEGFEKIVESLKEIFQDDVFIQDIRGYEKDRDGKTEEEGSKARLNVIKSTENEKYDDMIVDIQEQEIIHQDALNQILIDYMAIIKTYVLAYIKKLYEKKKENES
jgi:hypothetical protein